MDRRRDHEVDFILDTYRVRGQLLEPGIPRRLVDYLNNIDHNAAFVIVQDGTIDLPVRSNDASRVFETIQVHLDSILFAFPHGRDVLHSDPMEIVQKRPIPATIAVPEFELSGLAYLVRDVHPERDQLLGIRHFIAMTDVSIVSAATDAVIWHEPIVVVNLARAVLFAPSRSTPALPALDLVRQG